MYSIKFVTFSGMPLPAGDNFSREEAKEIIRRKNNAAKRRGQPVTKIGKGRWEHGEEENCGMIGDHHGYLIVTKTRNK